MMRRPSPGSFACALAAALLLQSSLAAAQLPGFVDPGLRWRTLDTEHFSVHFAEQNRAQARLAAQVAETGRSYGRLGNSAFEGMMRAEVARGLRPLREINAEGRGFPLNRDYLYGSYFFAFVRERYGEKAVTDLVEDYSDNIVPFRVHSNPVRVTGKPMDALWVEYQDWLRARFAPKAAGAGASGEGEVLARAFSLASPVLAPGGTRWYVQGDGYTLPRLVRQAAGGKAEKVREVEQDTRLAGALGDALLLAQLEICRDHNLLYDLYRVDARGGITRLTRCERNRFAAPLEDGRIVTLRVAAGEAEVVLLDSNR